MRYRPQQPRRNSLHSAFSLSQLSSRFFPPALADITLYFGTKRAANWDNFHKLSCDALAGIAYEDDKQIKRAVVTVAYDKQKPHIEVALSEL